MKKQLKKLLCAALSLTMVAGSVVLPAAVLADGETELKSWKFDFGSADNVADGYIAITPDTDYYANDSQGYGFLGINENGYKLSNRLDGFEQQEGQVIELEAGGSTTDATLDGIGVVGAGGDDVTDEDGNTYGTDLYGNKADEYYPVRFAVGVEDETYYKIKATVTTLDPTKDATASLYTERKHPLYTEKTIAAGETVTTEFTIRVTPIYYQKSDPQGAIADGMINVCVLGENSALAALEIEQVETAPTLWVLGDSTVTDGPGQLPFTVFPNYTGVGTGLTKYLSSDIAVVNEGEGGLNAADSLHFNMVSSRIKEGDYMYVEYGHNHKDDGAAGYKACLDKYYDVCHSVGAKLIIVSPIERINDWDDTAKEYQHGLRDFATAGEEYVAEKISGGANDIAYVDLNQYSLDFYNKIVADNNDDADAIKFYFQTEKGGGTDTTHPNDAGAENLAYEFIKAAKAVTDETQIAVLSDLLTGLSDETPNLVSEDAMAGGLAGDAWPTYNPPVTYEYPIVIKDVALDENNQFTTLTAYVQASFSNYASGVLEILDGDGNIINTYVTTNHVDNTSGKGTNVLSFGPVDGEGNQTGDSGIYLEEGQTYRAYMWSCSLDEERLLTEEEGGEQLSGIYTPTEIDTYILPGENGNVEDFNHYSQTTLTGSGKYVYGGSAASELTLGVDDNGVTYTRVMSDGAKNGAAGQGSFYIMRPLENLVDENDNAIGTGDSGRYMIDVDIMYTSGGGLNFAFCENTTPTKSPFVSNQFTAFGIGSGGVVTVSGQEVGTISGTSWTNVKYILDMNAGTAEVSVAGGTPVTVDVPEYQTFGAPSISTLKHFILEGQKVAFDVKLSNMTVAKLKDSGATTTLSVDIDEPEQPDIYNVTVTADKAYNGDDIAALITAKYTADGVLTSVEASNVELVEGEQTFEIELDEDTKLMLWDGLDTMKPFDITVTPKVNETVVMGTVYAEEEGTTETTVTQGSTVTAYAVPEEGYVFVKWIDADGNDFSTESELNIRLYKDLALSAQFALQGGLEDTASYKVVADKSLVKAGTEQIITLTLEDVFDAAGNPVKYSDSDALWSCDDSAIDVTGGIVTIPADYTIDGSTKDITVTCTLNNIERKTIITLYSYEFFEDVSGGTTTAQWDGDITTIASKNCIVFPGGGNTSTLTLPAPVEIGDGRTVSYKAVWSGSNTCGQSRYIELYDSQGNKIINETILYSWGTLYVGGTIGSADAGDGTAFASAIVKDSWSSDVVITINNDGTGTLAFGSDTADITVNTNATDIAAIKLIAVTGASDYTQRALGITDITIK